MFLLLLSLLLISMIIEALVLRLVNRPLWNTTECWVNLSLGASNLAVGMLVISLHLSAYQYLHQHWALISPLSHPFQQLLAALLLYDFFYYCSHRAHHRCNLLWANHLVHHSGRHFNLTTGMRLGFLGNFTAWPFFLPMALLGISLEHYLLVIAAQAIYQFFIHTPLAPELGWLEKVLVTPSQHRVHHASNPKYLDRNFGCFLVIWDRLFKTYQRELAEDPPRYGTLHPIAKAYSPGYLNCFLYAACLRQAWHEPSLKSVALALLGSPPRLQAAMADSHAAALNGNLLSTIKRLLPSTLISAYLIFNAAELNPSDKCLVLLSVLLTNLLHSKSDTRQQRRVLITVMPMILETGLVLYLLSHYASLHPLLWVTLASSLWSASKIGSTASNFTRS